MRRRFSRVTLAITAVAIVAIAGGVTYAVADIGSGGVIHGCYKSQNGQLRPKKTRHLRRVFSWARLGSNQRPPACEAGALPLSYAPGRASE
jgi:hypothetical protein